MSDTVNQSGMCGQNSERHSFSASANQYGWARVPRRLVIIVAPEMVDTAVTIA